MKGLDSGEGLQEGLFCGWKQTMVGQTTSSRTGAGSQTEAKRVWD